MMGYGRACRHLAAAVAVALSAAGALTAAHAAAPAADGTGAPGLAQPAALTTRVLATPYPGPARSIGSAANGCLAGAVPLPVSGPGWETLRPERNRFWGNPALVSFIEDMGSRLAPSLGRLMVLDMTQPRGGHMTYAHAAHQTGVDVDFMYSLAPAGPLDPAVRATPVLDSVVTAEGGLDPKRWGPAQTALLKAFASDARVERIFVNAAIKRALCHSVGGDRAWLRTLRPWYGHDEHFHVRIKCPAGDRECIPGPPIPEGDGCNALDWWFTPEALHPKPGAPAKPKVLPAACHAILAP